MPKLPQPDINLQKQKQGQRTAITKKHTLEKQPNPTWGKMLTREELLALLARLDAKKKEREMSKLSDTIAKALAKKQGKTHVDGSEVNNTIEKKAKVKPLPGPGKKPQTRSAGRGR